VQSLLVKDPERRLSAAKALEHPFITQHRSMRSISPGGGEKTPAAVALKREASIAQDLRNFGQQNAMRRACARAMAWSLPPEEQKEMRKAFLAMDTKGTGVIHREDFKKVLLKHYGHLEDAGIKEVFDSIDSTHHNGIHYSDFCAAVVSARDDLQESFAQEAFRRFDVHGTGKIGAADLQELLGESMEPQAVHELIRQISNDGEDSKCISREDFMHWVRSGKDKRETLTAINKRHDKDKMEQQASTDPKKLNRLNSPKAADASELRTSMRTLLKKAETDIRSTLNRSSRGSNDSSCCSCFSGLAGKKG